MEKGHQVLFVNRIYRPANKVYICLGQESEENDLATNLFAESDLICGCEADKEKDLVSQLEDFQKETKNW